MISLLKSLAVGLSMVTCGYSSNATNITETQNIPEDRSFSVGPALRILPLGDSITWGHGSPDGNGYRYKLLRLLAGNEVTFTGSQRSGSMTNSNNEGHSGALITDMSLYAVTSMHLLPNVILLLAGTNDIYKDVDTATAPARLGTLIDNLVTMNPNAAILVAQIPPMGDATRNAAAQIYNAAIPDIVASRSGSGAKVLTVEIDDRFTTNHLGDGLHPNELGYGLLADMFSTGIQRASEAGFINEPSPLPTVNRTVCDTFLKWDPKFGTIATGVGKVDSAFASSWQPVGRLANGNVGKAEPWLFVDKAQGALVRLADMDGDGRDDYLWVHPTTGATILYLNGGYSADGGVEWINKGEVATGIGEALGVVFADINGDGRDDYLWISPEGLVTAYINGGEKEGGGWLWTSIGQIAGEGTGATRETTRFADIDGDGRADYMVVGEGGSLNAWLNFGYGDKPDWHHLGVIATGIGEAAGVRLYDLNNDGRADYIWLDKDGAAKAYINNRGGSGGLAPEWINAGSIATGVGAKREEVRFADLNGDGKKDYVWVDPVSGALDVWLNTATGGSYVVGDGTVFADMNGDGFEDYLAIGPNGAIDLWLNHGYDTTSQKWNWDAQGQIATGVAARKDIRIADLDGDGLADYLVVNEKSGAVVFWRNGGKQSDGSWSWTNMGQVATGVGDGAGVRFADINGDGKADYIWIAKDGSAKAYLNGGNGSNGWIWESQGEIAKGVGASRQDIKFADINGDGLADYLWVNRIDGSVSEWQRNGGKREEWQWTPQGQIATGVGANGLAVQFASLNGNGRADYLKVDPATGAVTIWANGCFGEGSAGTDWLTATCDNPGITDASASPPLRWKDVDASNAWLAAIEYWRANQSPEDLAFARRISNLFNGPENMDCGLTAEENGCSTTVQCHDVKHPAGMFILNSFGQINRMNMNFYTALNNAQSNMSTMTVSFSEAFVPIKTQSAIAKLVVDIVGLGFSLVAAPAWNIGMKRFTYFANNPNNLGTIKDMTNGLVSNSLTIAKDAMPSSIKLTSSQSLEVAMSVLVTNWAERVSATNKKMFDGSPESIEQLTQMITDGYVLGGPGYPLSKSEDLEIQKFVQQAIFASLIPRAWSMSDEGFRPVILNSGQSCKSGTDFKKYMSDKTAKEASVCYEGTLYYFVSATEDYRKCTHTRNGKICVNSDFEPLPGMEALNLGSFGGITKKDLVIGALAGYKANGNRNGWSVAEPGKESTLSDLYDASIKGAGIHSPGVVMIPICDAELAVANWKEGNFDAPGFPCQPQTREKRRAAARERQL